MENKNMLNRIARFLILNSNGLDDAGLLNGKMGIAIFFYIFSRYSKNELYNIFADELLDDICDEVYINYNFANGLPGIAWGIEYLVRQNYIDPNSIYVLEDFDKKIIEKDVRYILDYSLETGLKGIAYYVINRLANRNMNNLLLQTKFLNELLSSLCSIHDQDNEVLILISQLSSIIKNQFVEINYYFLKNIINKSNLPIEEIFSIYRPLGLSNIGIASIGINLITNSKNEAKNIYI